MKKTINEPVNERVVIKRERRHDRGGIIWGTALLLAGLILIGNNSGIISPEIWGIIFSYWPILLITAGIDIIVDDLPGAEIVVGLLTIFLMGSVVILGLVQTGSPLVYTLGIDQWQWYNFINNINLPYRN